MRNLTFGELRPTIQRATGVCDSATQLALANESEERLLNRPNDPLGSIVRYRFCATAACLTLPRQVRNVIAFRLCDSLGEVRPLWWEFSANGPLLQTADSCPGNQLADHGVAVAFNDVNGTGKKIRVYAHNAADAGKTIILRYYREDTRAKVLTSYGGSVQEGEQLTLVAPPAYAVTTYNVMQGGLYSVIRQATTYPVTLYEYNGTSNTNTLAQYEPSETIPTYRRVMIPGLLQTGRCSGDDAACEARTITALVRLQHVPVALDNDPMVLGNVTALKLMCMAIQREEQNRHGEARELESKAQRELDGELAAYLGPGVQISLNMPSPYVWGAGAIPSSLGSRVGTGVLGCCG